MLKSSSLLCWSHLHCHLCWSCFCLWTSHEGAPVKGTHCLVPWKWNKSILWRGNCWNFYIQRGFTNLPFCSVLLYTKSLNKFLISKEFETLHSIPWAWRQSFWIGCCTPSCSRVPRLSVLDIIKIYILVKWHEIFWTRSVSLWQKYWQIFWPGVS